jgi:hypothetical protein
MSEGAKQFRVSVRVSDESVTEIPALAYSWFDPETETYQTARSKPIALRVMPAKVISAGDVVRSRSSAGGPTSSRTGNEAPNGQSKEVALATPSQPVFSLSGADLAIEPDANIVLRDLGGKTGGIVVQSVLYGAGLLLIAVAIVDRRRRNVDPVLIKRRKNVRRQRARIDQAKDLPKQDAAEEIAAAMRALVAELPDVARNEAEVVIAECESIVYAPAGQGEIQLEDAVIERARVVADRLPQPLPSGSEIQVVEARDRWARVRLFDGRDAWLQASSLELVDHTAR